MDKNTSMNEYLLEQLEIEMIIAAEEEPSYTYFDEKSVKE